MSVCPSIRQSVRLHGTTRLLLEWFSWKFIFKDFSKTSRENSTFIKIRQEKRVLHVKTNLHFWSNLAHFFLRMRNVSDNNCGEIKTHILCSVTRRLQKISPPTGIRSTDRPARSESLYRLSCPGPWVRKDKKKRYFQYELLTNTL